MIRNTFFYSCLDYFYLYFVYIQNERFPEKIERWISHVLHKYMHKQVEKKISIIYGIYLGYSISIFNDDILDVLKFSVDYHHHHHHHRHSNIYFIYVYCVHIINAEKKLNDLYIHFFYPFRYISISLVFGKKRSVVDLFFSFFFILKCFSFPLSTTILKRKLFFVIFQIFLYHSFTFMIR